MKIIIISELLIARCTAEKKNIFHIYNSVMNSDVEFVYEVYFNYKFNELENH